VTIPLARLLDKVRTILDTIASQQAKAIPPPLVLNKHCPQCEFQARCRQTAIEKDDLSLISNIGETECKKQNDKGIFTVMQLSYTFRPRRRPAPALKHHPALKALAIRKNQIHILGTPTLSLSGTPVYFDVEGDPDRDFYYLIGLRFRSGGSWVQYSFWAADPSDERNIWADCVHMLSAIEIPRLIHYGSYEAQFVKRMRTRYPEIGNPAFFPTYAQTRHVVVIVRLRDLPGVGPLQFVARLRGRVMWPEANQRRAFNTSLRTTANGICARIMGSAGINTAAAKV
jgi:predicted RecB family nuclease